MQLLSAYTISLSGAVPSTHAHHGTSRPHLTEFMRANALLPFAMVSFSWCTIRAEYACVFVCVCLSLSLCPLLEELSGIRRVDFEALVLTLYFVSSGFSQEPW